MELYSHYHVQIGSQLIPKASVSVFYIQGFEGKAVNYRLLRITIIVLCGDARRHSACLNNSINQPSVYMNGSFIRFSNTTINLLLIEKKDFSKRQLVYCFLKHVKYLCKLVAHSN